MRLRGKGRKIRLLVLGLLLLLVLLVLLKLLVLLPLLRNLMLDSGKLGQGVIEHTTIPGWLGQSIRRVSRKGNMAFVVIREHWVRICHAHIVVGWWRLKTTRMEGSFRN